MKRYIDVTSQVRKALIDVFKVDVKTIYNALNFREDSPLAKRIRKHALQRGGVDMVAVDTFDCIHDAEGVMTQLMPNGAVIKINRNTGDATVYYNGKPRIHVENIRIREIAALQESAMALK